VVAFFFLFRYVQNVCSAGSGMTAAHFLAARGDENVSRRWIRAVSETCSTCNAEPRRLNALEWQTPLFDWKGEEGAHFVLCLECRRPPWAVILMQPADDKFDLPRQMQSALVSMAFDNSAHGHAGLTASQPR
jgi:hypothetical protein